MLNLKVNDSTYIFPDNKPLKLLDVVADVPDLKIGCKKGICGICVVRVCSGIDNICAKTDAEKAALAVLNISENNFRLLCQCTINGDVSLCNKII
jgi:ferredoxin